jgi:DNA invertase Pin-like site-specific DNA recombinase
MPNRTATKPSSRPTRAAIYCRISKDRDGESTATDRQEKDCRAYCRREGFRVTKVFTDRDTSAYNGKKRPAYDEMMASLDTFDVMVFWKLDRLVRRIATIHVVVADTREANVRLVSLTENIDTSTPMGEAILGVLAAIGEEESRNISKRTKRAAEARAAEGKAHGGIRSFGYDIERGADGERLGTAKLIVIPEEEALVKDAVRRVLRGESLSSICRAWNEQGHLGTKGHEWTNQVLRQTLTSPRLAGLRVHQGDVIGNGNWKAIIKKKDHYRLLALFATRSRVGRPPVSLLGGGLLRCAVCNEPMQVSYTRGVRRYTCKKAPGRPGCGGPSIIAERTEAHVVKTVLERNPGRAHGARPDFRRSGGRVPSDAFADVERREKRLGDFTARWAREEITEVEWARGREVLLEDLAKAKARIREYAPTIVTTKGLIHAMWPTFTVDEQRDILASVLDYAVIHPATSGGRFTSDRISFQWIEDEEEEIDRPLGN